MNSQLTSPSPVPSALAATPPMGWNSWNMFGSSIHETNLRETADALVASGLKECGYEYLVIDDCWSVREGRDSDGNLVADPQKFPSGIKALADYVHDKGFKLGIYSDAAEKTCAGYPASYGFEEQDAALWASWGIDFLKYDYCNAPNEQEAAMDRYARMGEALRNTGRPNSLFDVRMGRTKPAPVGQERRRADVARLGRRVRQLDQYLDGELEHLRDRRQRFH